MTVMNAFDLRLIINSYACYMYLPHQAALYFVPGTKSFQLIHI